VGASGDDEGDEQMGRFPEVDPDLDLPALDARVLGLWRERKVFERSLEQRVGAEPFVFYEGPPTANGRPGVHHVEARVFKDLFPRFKTMRGYRSSWRSRRSWASPASATSRRSASTASTPAAASRCCATWTSGRT
jgi:hypothetical protein